MGLTRIRYYRIKMILKAKQQKSSKLKQKKKSKTKNKTRGFPGDSVIKSQPANAGDTRWIPGLGGPTRLGATRPAHHKC